MSAITSLKRKWDNNAVLDYAVNEAKQKGKMEIACEMKKGCIPVEQIAKFTKLSIEEIEKL